MAGKMVNQDQKPYRVRTFRVALLAIIVVLILIRIADIAIYKDITIIPDDFFFAVAIVQLFFLWFDVVREKNRMLWVQKKKSELDEMKIKFGRIASHELMTPIAMIRGYINLTRDKVLGELTEKQKNALDVMNKYSERLEEIKDSLAQLYTGGVSLPEGKLQPSSIEVLIRSATDDMMPFVKKRNLNLELDIERDIPHIMMDRGSMRQVLANLLLNAIRFTPDHGKIRIRAKDAGGALRVEVEDNGIGIPREKLSTIFESFYELQDSLKHSSGSIEFQSGGLGLGLTTARHIVEAHHGTIWVESEVGKYSNVIFILPKPRNERST
jgi:signal transduction histidine kinase